MVSFRRCPNLDEQDDQAIMLLQSVRKNMEGITKREVERAIDAYDAYDAQATMAYASEGDLKNEG